jgi:hypothetical protein
MCEEPRKYSVTLIDEVNDDIDELKGFYLDIADERSAFRFEGAFFEVLNSLDVWPYRFRMFDDDESIRRVNMVNHKVAIVYLVDEDVYEVVAVKAFHAMNDPERIRNIIDDRLAKVKAGSTK